MTDYKNNEFDDDKTSKYDFDDGIEFLDDTYEHHDNDYFSDYDDNASYEQIFRATMKNTIMTLRIPRSRLLKPVLVLKSLVS